MAGENLGIGFGRRLQGRQGLFDTIDHGEQVADGRVGEAAGDTPEDLALRGVQAPAAGVAGEERVIRPSHHPLVLQNDVCA